MLGLYCWDEVPGLNAWLGGGGGGGDKRLLPRKLLLLTRLCTVFGFAYCSVKPRAYFYVRRQLSRDSMTGSQMLALQKQRKKCGGGKLLQLGISFGYERLSNHVEDVVKAIQSLQTLGVFRPKKLMNMLITEQQRKKWGAVVISDIRRTG